MAQSLDFEQPIRALREKITELKRVAETQKIDLSGEIRILEDRADRLTKEIFAGLTPWQQVLLARHPHRPLAEDYMKAFCTDVVELHGDRAFRDDKAILTAFATIDGIRTLVVATRRGKTMEERNAFNYGMPHPEGYRKAMLKMKLAERLGLPIVVLINTPGAYPGVGAEERGQAMAIAENLREMSRLTVPVLCIIVGEGFSGGALGIGVGDRLVMQENTVYSVISPEGCAAILWKDRAKAPEAAEALKLTAKDLLGLGIVDEVVPEPPGGAHVDPARTAEFLKASITRNLKSLLRLPARQLVEERYEKYRRIGEYFEGAEESLYTSARRAR